MQLQRCGKMHFLVRLLSGVSGTRDALVFLVRLSAPSVPSEEASVTRFMSGLLLLLLFAGSVQFASADRIDSLGKDKQNGEFTVRKDIQNYNFTFKDAKKDNDDHLLAKLDRSKREKFSLSDDDSWKGGKASHLYALTYRTVSHVPEPGSLVLSPWVFSARQRCPIARRCANPSRRYSLPFSNSSRMRRLTFSVFRPALIPHARSGAAHIYNLSASA